MGVLFESAVGDDRAFERLYSSYAQSVFRYALAVLGQQADAEDVTQTTFMNAYRALRRGERPLKPENWLIAIARNACIERFRHAQRRPREVALEREPPVAAVQGDEATTATELQHALLQLPPAQRAALVMRELEGRSYAETAAALRISNSALETLLVRARRTLREQLEDEVSCGDAAAAIKMQLEGGLPISGRRILRAHLRSCDDCATLARRLRAQKKTLRGLPTFSLPLWVGRLLAGGSGAGASATGGIGAAGLALKAAAILAVGAAVGGGAYAGATHLGPLGVHRKPGSFVRGTSSRSESLSVALRSQRSATHRLSGYGPRAAVFQGGGAPSPDVPAAGSTAASSQAPRPGLPASGSSYANAGPVTGMSTSGPSTVRVGAADTARTASGKGVVASGNGKSRGTAASAAARAATKVPPGQAKRAANGNSNGTATGAAVSGSSASKAAPSQAKDDANAVSGTAAGTSSPPAAQVSAAPSVPPGQAGANGSDSANANPNANGANAHGHG